jgi:hypothetical protein
VWIFNTSVSICLKDNKLGGLVVVVIDRKVRAADVETISGTCLSSSSKHGSKILDIIDENSAAELGGKLAGCDLMWESNTDNQCVNP